MSENLTLAETADGKRLLSDDLHERSMRMSSLALLRAVQRAQGIYVAPTFTRAKKPRPAVVRTPKPKLRQVIPGMVAKDIIKAVSEAFELTPAEITSPRRSLAHILARQVVIRLLRDRTWVNGEPRFSTPQIGRIVNRDHTSVIHALQTFEAKSRAYPEMRVVYDAMKAVAL